MADKHKRLRHRVVQKDGHVELHHDDGSVSYVRDELQHERILKALRKGNGRGMYVHSKPREDK